MKEIRRSTIVFFVFFVASLAMAFFISPFSSPWPDGLERVAIDKGFIEKGEGKPIIPSPLPDYTLPLIKNERLSTSVAGLIGTLTMFGLAYAIGQALRSKGGESQGELNAK